MRKESQEPSSTVKSGIYMIRNVADGRVYIGQSFDVDKRQIQHICSLKRGDHNLII